MLRRDVGARRSAPRTLVLLLCMLLARQTSAAYSFLTHETIIDLTWATAIQPALLSRFPRTTPAELRRARAYAYGGSAIQDAGYYPFGHGIFSDLTHYVRTGDFITFLIRDARNVNDLAFALGALSHYMGDTVGHEQAVNPSTAIEFPGLEKEYGPVVSYAESPHAHVRTEFAFDIDQLSQGRFAPALYLHSAGFVVPRRVLEDAFFQTYGLRLHDILGNEYAAFHSYQSSVRRLLPRFAYAEVLLHRKSFPADAPTPAFQQFDRNLKQANRENGWYKFPRKKTSLSTRWIAALIFLAPRIGPISDLAIRGPNEETEKRYVESVNRCVGEYSKLLKELASQGQDGFHLENLDLDTGDKVRPGVYRLTDETYAKLLHQLVRKNSHRRTPSELRQNVLDFYSDPGAPIATKQHPKAWKKVEQELAALQAKP
ncbi:MAG TPA: zinc dependent phospholipase C family protein [Acidobacteriaceae bacterium]|nr:zinc dependent phospholipase C family protein [Acidobacteriaceae bacterium]